MFIRHFGGRPTVTTRNSTKSSLHFASTVLLTNTFYKRYTFWNIRQEETESVDAYLTRIRLKLEMYEYAAEAHQDLARDKFVFGLIDDCTKERLLCKEKLDLSTAVAIAQQAESSGKQIKEMSTTTHTEINIMQRSRDQTNQTTYCDNCGRRHKP